MKKPERNDLYVELQRESIDAMGMTCSQCDVTDMTNKKLWVYYTMRGSNRRTHNGQFCSKRCHDIFHGLRPREFK